MDYQIVQQMNHITIDLPEAEARFLTDFASKNELTVNQLFDRFVKDLHRYDAIDPAIRSLIGILRPNTDVDAARMEYLNRKYLNGEGNA
jgi:hypothetical protein